MSWRRVDHLLRSICVLAWLAVASLAAASEYHGQVTLGGLPVPGATVTATQGDKKVVAVTDTQGLYSFPDLADGKWTIQVEMTGFAAIQQEVAVAPDVAAARWELKLMSLDQMRAAAKPLKVEAAPPVVAASTPAATGNRAPTPAKPQDSKAAAVAAAPPPPVEDASVRASDGLLINGSVNNSATSQFALAQGFGNSRPGGKGLYTGGLTLVLANSALNAKNFSITGQDTPKPSFSNTTGYATLFGPIKIPHLMPRGPTFSINYQWTRNSTDSIVSALVPTQAEQGGNLSQAPNVTAIYAPTAGPATTCLLAAGVTPGAAFPSNVIPAACISSTAKDLLALYPSPNGTSQYNYQAPLIGSMHQDGMQLRMNKGIGQRNNFYGLFAFQSTRSANQNLFGFVDTSDVLGINSNINWQHRFRQRLFMTFTYGYSRSRTRTKPFFEDRVDVEGMDQIGGTASSSPRVDPSDWGPPGLTFSSGITGLSDGNGAFNRSQSNALTYDTAWNHQRHNLHFGGDFRRGEFNYLAQANPRGTFTFTQNGATGNGTAGSGSDFADFLLGIPDTSAIAFGNADKYLRQSTYDAFITDDWRARPELTINAGVRWEYGAPITELFGRLVNLDVVPGPLSPFTSAATIEGSNPVGSLTGQSYPTSLIRPDKSGIAPTVGISWRPISGSSVLVKSGYGIYHNTSVYQSAATGMDQQAPLSTSVSASNSAACQLSLANGFPANCLTTTPYTFGVDPNFRVGYVQAWQLSVQRDLPGSLQLLATYSGNKGTRGVQQFLPNTYPIGATNPCPSCPSGYSYRTSNGDSTHEAGSLQLRRRLRNGLTANLLYTYSKSIDDDSFLGGQGPVAAGATSQTVSAGTTAQNWLDLRGERGLSTFDQRHLLNAQLQYTTGMGIGGRTLMSGWKGRFYKEWTLLTNIAVGSGLPETPSYFEALQGAACTTCVRPNVTGTSIHAAPAGLFLNPAAFVAPLTGQFGDARVGSITGPNQFTLNASMARTFRLHDRYNLDIRLDSTNTLNHVTYSGWQTTVGSPLFGEPAAANAMRAASATMRLRF
jgi:trimeric autotransporter adhesin